MEASCIGCPRTLTGMLTITSRIGEEINLPKRALPHTHTWSFFGKRMEFLTSVPVSNIGLSPFFREYKDTLVEGILKILNTILSCTYNKYSVGENIQED